MPKTPPGTSSLAFCSNFDFKSFTWVCSFSASLAFFFIFSSFLLCSASFSLFSLIFSIVSAVFSGKFSIAVSTSFEATSFTIPFILFKSSSSKAISGTSFFCGLSLFSLVFLLLDTLGLSLEDNFVWRGDSLLPFFNASRILYFFKYLAKPVTELFLTLGNFSCR